MRILGPKPPTSQHLLTRVAPRDLEQRLRRSSADPELTEAINEAAASQKLLARNDQQNHTVMIVGGAESREPISILNCQVAVVSNIGTRAEQQDSAIIRKGLFLLADGIARSAKGGKASGLAIRTVHTFWLPDDPTSFERGVYQARDLIDSHFDAENKENTGGTTFAGMAIYGDTAHFCRIGDSRIFRVRDNNLELLTIDENLGTELYVAWRGFDLRSYLQNSVGSRFRNWRGPRLRDYYSFTQKNPYSCILRNSLEGGRKDQTTIRVFQEKIKPGDLYIICSDGLHDYLPFEVFEGAVELAESPQELVKIFSELLVNQMHSHQDNFTIIAVQV